MPRPSNPRLRPQSSSEASPANSAALLTEDQLARWTELIADGRTSFPNGLTAAQAQQLGHAVRRRRHARLRHWIAHVIALDLQRDPGPSPGD
jgi:hypothetical protein